MKYLFLLLPLFILQCSATSKSHFSHDLEGLLSSRQNVSFHKERFRHEIDLTKIIKMQQSGVSTVSCMVHSQLTFIDCVFDEKLILYRDSLNMQYYTEFMLPVTFINCEFKKGVDFKNSVFRSQLTFSHCVFNQNAIFQNITCMQQVNFIKSYFLREAAFQNSTYNHDANFSEIIANDHIFFQGSSFRKLANFSMSETHNYADFSSIQFFGNTMMNYMKWSGRAVLNNSIFYGNAQFVGSTFNEINKENLLIPGILEWKDKK